MPNEDSKKDSKAPTFVISKSRCNQPGQCLLVVLKDGKADKGGNAYVQQQMPEDFADYLIGLQNGHANLSSLN